MGLKHRQLQGELHDYMGVKNIVNLIADVLDIEGYGYIELNKLPSRNGLSNYKWALYRLYFLR